METECTSNSTVYGVQLNKLVSHHRQCQQMSTEVDPTERLASLGAEKQVTEDLLSTEDNFSSLLCTALLET